MVHGLPDYYRMEVPTRFVLGKNQEAWTDLWTGNVGVGAVATVEAYTVPVGYRLYLAGGVITCNASCIQKVRLVHTPGILGDFRYDVNGTFMTNPPLGEVLDAGDVLNYYVYNNDIKERSFSVCLLGILEKVSA